MTNILTPTAETTTLQLRRGTRAENDAFTGAEAEVVVDTDTHTLRVHDEIQEGGYEIALASMTNVETASLAEGRPDGSNLMYHDLRNLIASTADASTKTAIASILVTDYKLAYENMSNVNTKTLAQGADKLASGTGLAYYDMSNVNTDDLATVGHGHSGKNLAYYDMSNVETKTLAAGNDKLAIGDGLAYANATNINTAELASVDHEHGNPLLYADGSNYVDSQLAQYHFEFRENKDTDISTVLASEDYHYATVYATQQYLITNYETLANKYPSTSAWVDPVDQHSLANDTNYPTTAATERRITEKLTTAMAELDTKYVIQTTADGFTTFDYYARQSHPKIIDLGDCYNTTSHNYELDLDTNYQALLTDNTTFLLPDPADVNIHKYRLVVQSGPKLGYYVKEITGNTVTLTKVLSEARNFNTVADAITYADGKTYNNAKLIPQEVKFDLDCLNQIELFMHVDEAATSIVINWGCNYWLDNQEIEIEAGGDYSIVWRYVPTVKTGVDTYGAWCVSSYDIAHM